MLWLQKSLISALLLLGSASVAKADFGDYVDPSFDCPAMTTCKQVCVANVADCPPEMLCGANETLCGDGTCARSCTGREESPCEFKCAPIACQKVDDSFDLCQQKYGPLAELEAACGEAEAAEETKLFAFNEPGFVVYYVWMCTATFLLVSWCAFNQRFSPVEGSTQSLELSFTTSGDKNSSQGFQTGYQLHPVGRCINFVTVMTLLGIQAVLAFLTIQYYVQQELITSLRVIFEDEIQVLIAFEIAWGKWQTSPVSTQHNAMFCRPISNHWVCSHWRRLDIRVEVSLFDQKCSSSPLRPWRGNSRRHRCDESSSGGKRSYF